MSERSIISWNVPNLVTVPLMAFAGFLVLAAIWQFAGHAFAPSGPLGGLGLGSIDGDAGE